MFICEKEVTLELMHFWEKTSIFFINLFKLTIILTIFNSFNACAFVPLSRWEKKHTKNRIVESSILTSWFSEISLINLFLQHTKLFLFI